MQFVQLQTPPAVGRPRAGVPSPGRRRPPAKGFLRALSGRHLLWLSLLCLIIAWEVIGRNTIKALFPTFVDVLVAWKAVLVSAKFWLALLGSIQALAGGFSLAVITGIGLGLLAGRFKAVYAFIDIYLICLLAMPMGGILPVVSAFLGFGLSARIAVVFFFCFVYICNNTIAGVRNTSPQLEEMAKSFGAKPLVLFLKVILPEALPYILTGLKVGMARAVLGMLVSEMILSVTGLGAMIKNAAELYDTDIMFALIFSVVGFSYLLIESIKALETRLVRWKRSVMMDD